jgi:2-keto-4-pentenoate hydratase
MAPSTADQAAGLLLQARAGGPPLEDLPEDLRPTTVEQAYAIQDAVNRQLGRIAGWKVSPLRGTTAPNCAPIGAALIHASPARLALSALPAAEVEAEIAVTLAHDLPPRAAPYGPDDLRAAIASVHPALEVVHSRFRDRKSAPQLSVVADSQGNAALVLGPALQDWQGLELGGVAMRLRIGGVEVAAAEGGFDTANVLASLAWLANHAVIRCGGLKRGDVVLTGARAGPKPVGPAPAAVLADASGLGRVEIAFD